VQLFSKPGQRDWHTLYQALFVRMVHEETRITVATGLRTTLATAVKSKAAAVILGTVVAVGTVGGGTVAAAANGAFGQQVKAHVESCKDALAKGTHGIGDCVSDFTQQHNQSQQHSQGNGASNAHGTHSNNGNNNGNHGGPPSATPGASHGKGHGNP
jgi:hypothetical protein